MADLVHHDGITVFIHLQLAEEAQSVYQVFDVNGVPELLPEDLEDESLQDAFFFVIFSDAWNDWEIVVGNVVFEKLVTLTVFCGSASQSVLVFCDRILI